MYYDDCHTPVAPIERLYKNIFPLEILFDGSEGWREADCDNAVWDRTDLFVAEVQTRAIRANARYQDGYNLSATLSRPALASVVAGVIRERGADLLIHGFAGNDQLRFEAGLPVALDNRRLPLTEIIESLNRIGREGGIGWHDLVEDGYVGLKSRALYFSPAADIILAAHSDLARFTGSRADNMFRKIAEAEWSRLVYDAGWFDPLRENLDAYFEAADRWATGAVTIALHCGQIRVVARTSFQSLYDETFSIYRAGQDFGSDLIRGLRDQVVLNGQMNMRRKEAVKCDV